MGKRANDSNFVWAVSFALHIVILVRDVWTEASCRCEEFHVMPSCELSGTLKKATYRPSRIPEPSARPSLSQSVRMSCYPAVAARAAMPFNCCNWRVLSISTYASTAYFRIFLLIEIPTHSPRPQLKTRSRLLLPSPQATTTSITPSSGSATDRTSPRRTWWSIAVSWWPYSSSSRSA